MKIALIIYLASVVLALSQYIIFALSARIEMKNLKANGEIATPKETMSKAQGTFMLVLESLVCFIPLYNILLFLGFLLRGEEIRKRVTKELKEEMAE